jgi:hypothetical protein
LAAHIQEEEIVPAQALKPGNLITQKFSAPCEDEVAMVAK